MSKSDKGTNKRTNRQNKEQTNESNDSTALKHELIFYSFFQIEKIVKPRSESNPNQFNILMHKNLSCIKVQILTIISGT